jgi:DNA-binding beta-propeller fold protein YncE
MAILLVANTGNDTVVKIPVSGTPLKAGGQQTHRSPRPGQSRLQPQRKLLYVTNLALDLTLFSPTFAAVDSQWAAQATTYTVSRIRTRIRPVEGSRESGDRDDEDGD